MKIGTEDKKKSLVAAGLLLVAVVLSAQATDAGVNKATKPLFAVADTPEKMAALGEAAQREGTPGPRRA